MEAEGTARRRRPGRPLTSPPALPPAELTISEWQVVTEQLEQRQDQLDQLRPLDEPNSPRPAQIVAAVLGDVERIVANTASALSGTQLATLRSDRREQELVRRLAELVIYARIGEALTTAPALKSRLDQWAVVHAAEAAAPARTKNRFTKRRSRAGSGPRRAVTELMGPATRSLDELTRRVRRERETEELPGADWAPAIAHSVDRLVVDLAKLRMPARFVLRLLADVRALPGGCWPPLPSDAAIRKRLQRLQGTPQPL